jgi:hypothetical protein
MVVAARNGQISLLWPSPFHPLSNKPYHNRSLQLSLLYKTVKLLRDGGSSKSIRIQNTSLAPDNELMVVSLADPEEVV